MTRLKHVVCIDWLSRSIIVGGCRNGEVVLVDKRIRPKQGTNVAVRIRHPRGVFRVKRVDECRILAAGPKEVSSFSFLHHCSQLLHVSLLAPLVVCEAVCNPQLLPTKTLTRRLPQLFYDYQVAGDIGPCNKACSLNLSKGSDLGSIAAMTTVLSASAVC